MAERAMLESSMLLHRDSANYLLALARVGPMEVVVSKRLLEIAGSEPESLARRLAPRLDIPPAVMDLATTRVLARELSQVVETYRLPPESDRPLWYDEGARFFYDHLQEWTKDELAAQILFEEWHFLTGQSWIFSKTRQAFDGMVEAGGTAIHMSSKLFDCVVRKTLRKGPDEPLTPGNRARAAAKWVAVGGPAILSVVEPISGAVSQAASGYFLLVDP